jgi:hypothetical protein
MYGHLIYGSLLYMAYMVLYITYIEMYGSIYGSIHGSIYGSIYGSMYGSIWEYRIYMVLYGNKRTYLVKCWYGGELLRKHRVGYVFFNLFGSGNIMRIYGYKTIHFMKRMDIYMRGNHFHWFGGNESTGNPWVLTVKQIVLTMFSSCSFVKYIARWLKPRQGHSPGGKRTNNIFETRYFYDIIPWYPHVIVLLYHFISHVFAFLYGFLPFLLVN